MMRGRVGRWLVIGTLGVTTLIATPVSAQSIGAGQLELTLAVGGGRSLPRDDPEVQPVTSYNLLPHLGYFVTDEVGPRWVRGNLEILLEPTLIYLDGVRTATVVGAAVLPRWVFAVSPRVRPYVETGGGVVGGEVDLRQTNCDFNFLFEAGAGAMMFLTDRVALTVGARYHHLSNGDRCAKNAGINSVIGVVGISYFMR